MYCWREGRRGGTDLGLNLEVNMKVMMNSTNDGWFGQLNEGHIASIESSHFITYASSYAPIAMQNNNLDPPKCKQVPLEMQIDRSATTTH